MLTPVIRQVKTGFHRGDYSILSRFLCQQPKDHAQRPVAADQTGETGPAGGNQHCFIIRNVLQEFLFQFHGCVPSFIV